MPKAARLFHVSEQAGIGRFQPRPVPAPDSGIEGDAVWAVDEEHLANFLLPRDCPRVTFRMAVNTTSEDKARFFAHSSARAVIAVEARWFPAISSCRLYLYEMPPKTFLLAVAPAGYYISREAVSPIAVSEMDNLVARILEREVELRILPGLWPLSDAVAASSLEFSIIRMKNAAPRAHS